MANKNDELWMLNGPDTRKLAPEPRQTVKIPNDVRKSLKALATQGKKKNRRQK